MHELAITQSVVEAVTERTGSAPVASVRLRVGRLAGVVPDAMRFCFELVTAGTPLEGRRSRSSSRRAAGAAGPAARSSRWPT